MDQLRQLAEDNYELIEYVVVGLGDWGLSVAKLVIDLGTPILQNFFA